MITVTDFGKTPAGDKCKLYTIDNGSMKVSICDYGARIVDIFVPDKNGELTDVSLGFESADDYARDDYIGATIGRCGNRIENAQFELNGKVYNLAQNCGKDHLHGGVEGFNKKLFSAEYENNSVRMSLLSPDMDEGYPGNLTLSVIFTLTEENSILIEYNAVCDQDTVVNFTNHSYFNLSGATSGKTIEDHIMRLYADAFCDTYLEAPLVNGVIRPVKGTPLDFSTEKRVGDSLMDKSSYPINTVGGIDHNYVHKLYKGDFEKCAEIYCEDTGISLECITDQPGFQVYTALHFKDILGKHETVYNEFAGICFETQNFPNAPSFSYFPTPILKKGEPFYSKTEYKFSVK